LGLGLGFDFADYSLFIKGILGVQHGEHFLVQRVEELVHDLQQIHATVGEVRFQLLEEIREDIRISLVDDAVCANEHTIELGSRLFQQGGEDICRRKNELVKNVTRFN